jgi:hypothetical protein
MVGVGSGVLVGVGSGVLVGVGSGVLVGVGSGVLVGVGVGVKVLVAVGVEVLVGTGVLVAVGVAVGSSSIVTSTTQSLKSWSPPPYKSSHPILTTVSEMRVRWACWSPSALREPGPVCQV